MSFELSYTKQFTADVIKTLTDKWLENYANLDTLLSLEMSKHLKRKHGDNHTSMLCSMDSNNKLTMLGYDSMYYHHFILNLTSWILDYDLKKLNLPDLDSSRDWIIYLSKLESLDLAKLVEHVNNLKCNL